MLGAPLDGLGQFFWSDPPQSEVDGRQVIPKESVEFRVVRRAVLGAEPPAPIAALRGEKRFLRSFESGLSRRIVAALRAGFHGMRVGFTRIPKQFPGGHVLTMSDPDIKICIDPRGRENPAG